MDALDRFQLAEWGYAVEDVGTEPDVAAFPFSGSRFLVAGTILLTWSAWRAGWRLDLRRADVTAAAVVGLGLLAGGQGAASWASQYVPAGIVAVMITTVPIWIVLFSW